MDKLNRTNKWSDDEIMLAMKEVWEDLVSKGHNVIYICVYGSQNYGLDLHTEDYQSDLDMKVVVAPTLKQLVNNSKQTTFTQDTKYGQVDVKDIRLFVNNLKKANPAYIECIFTEHYIIKEGKQGEAIQEMRDMAEDLCFAQETQMIKAMFGMMKEKEKALCHPYPTIKHKIDKFGYDGKQLSHALRLGEMMKRYLNGETMKYCIMHHDQLTAQKMIDYKLNKPSLEEARRIMGELIGTAKHYTDEQVNKGMEPVYGILEAFDKAKNNAITRDIYDVIYNEALQDAKLEINDVLNNLKK